MLPRSADGARVSLASLGSWGACLTEAAFLSSQSWLSVFSWSTWGSRGPWTPRRPVPPRHAGQACGSRDVRAVHPEAAWLSWQAWDARGPWGAGEAARAAEALQVAAKTGSLHVDEGQPVGFEGGPWGPRRPLGSWGSPRSDSRIPLLALGAHVSWGPWEALWPSVPGLPVFTRITRLTVPSRGAVLPRGSRGPRGSLWSRNRLCLMAVYGWACRTLGADGARGALSARLSLLPLQASLFHAAPRAPNTLIPRANCAQAGEGLSS